MPCKKGTCKITGLLFVCAEGGANNTSLRKQEICFMPLATAVTSPSRWEHLEMLQDSSLFTPPGLELCAGGRVLAGKSAAPTICSHAVFPHCLFLGFPAGSMGIRALTSSICKQGADLQWGWGFAAGSWTQQSLPLDSKLPGPQSSSPGWDYAQCSQYFMYCSLGCVSSDSSWRIYWQEGWGGMRGKEKWCLFPVSQAILLFLP